MAMSHLQLSYENHGIAVKYGLLTLKLGPLFVCGSSTSLSISLPKLPFSS